MTLYTLSLVNTLTFVLNFLSETKLAKFSNPLEVLNLALYGAKKAASTQWREIHLPLSLPEGRDPISSDFIKHLELRAQHF